MQRIARVVLVIAGLFAGARHLAAQDHTLGLNLQVLGSTQIGVTIFMSPALALRPSLSANWGAVETGFGSFESSSFSFILDVLLRHATWDRVTLYSGPGVLVGYMNPANDESTATWGLRYLLGARLRVVDRVSLFAEAALSYRNFGDAGGEAVGLGTQSLGIIVFLK